MQRSRPDGAGLARGFGTVSREERLQAELFLADLLGHSRSPQPVLPPPAEHQVVGAPVLRAGAVGPAVDGTVNLAHIGLVSPSGAFPGSQLTAINGLTPTFVNAFARANHRVSLDLATNPPSPAFSDEAQFSFAGTDAQRWESLRWGLFDPATVAAIATRGGHGATRLLDELAAWITAQHAVRAAPRWPLIPPEHVLFPPKRIVGFSDFTAVLLAVYSLLGWASIHGPMLCCPGDGASRTRLVEILTTAPANLYPNNLVQANLNLVGAAPANPIRGVMLGGNLALVDALYGSPFFPSLQGGLLFAEETNEEGRKIDRMIEGLKQRGAASQARAVVVGHTTSIPPRAVATLFQRSWNVPCVFELPSGHRVPPNNTNLALWIGLEYELQFPAAGGASLFLRP
jgi:muramoyltetrapeptide carboxypeptidase